MRIKYQHHIFPLAATDRQTTGGIPNKTDKQELQPRREEKRREEKRREEKRREREEKERQQTHSSPLRCYF